ncbi:hypothetical protein Efla_002947 [Eimeria flavescens]
MTAHTVPRAEAAPIDSAAAAAAAAASPAAAAAAVITDAAATAAAEPACAHSVVLSVHFLRHAEGTHNVGAKNRPPGRSCEWVYGQQEHFDADLSPAGVLQAREAATQMPQLLLHALQQQQKQQQVCCCCPAVVVYTSALRRTIRTAYELIKAAFEGPTAGAAAAAAEPLDVPVIALDETREWAGGGHFCDGRHL